MLINVLAVDQYMLYVFCLQYATVDKDNEKYLSYKDFVCDYLKLIDEKNLLMLLLRLLIPLKIGE